MSDNENNRWKRNAKKQQQTNKQTKTKKTNKQTDKQKQNKQTNKHKKNKQTNKQKQNKQTNKKTKTKKTNKQTKKETKTENNKGDGSYSERLRAKWFCCVFKLGLIKLICKASLIFKSNLELLLSIILKERELY